MSSELHTSVFKNGRLFALLGDVELFVLFVDGGMLYARITSGDRLHITIKRADSTQHGQRTVARIPWWERYLTYVPKC